MSHQTKCPSCHAIYPMPSAKLGDPNAKARCGRCQQVFLLNDNLVVFEDTQKKKGVNLDALNAVIPEMPTPPAPKPKKREKPVPTGDVIFDDMDDEDDDTGKKDVKVSFSDRELDSFLNNDVSFHQPTTSTLDEQKSQQDDESWVKDLLDDSKPSAPTQNSQHAYTSRPSGVDFDDVIPVAPPPPKKNVALHRILADKDPTAQELASRTPLGVQLAWLLGCMLLVGVLLAQYVFFNLNTIVKNPSHASLLNNLCAVAKCTLPKPDLSALTITHDHTSKDFNTNIIVRIHNKGADPVLFSHLLVTAKDVNGKVLGEFVVADKDYISEGQNSLLGGQNKRIMLTVNTVKFVSTVDVKPFY